MFKKIFSVLAVALIATSLFASAFQIGATGRFGGSDITDIEAYKDFSAYSYGVDTRINFRPFSVVANVLIGHGENTTKLDTMLSFNLRADLKLFDFAFGVGYEVPLEFGDDGLLIDGQPMSQAIDVFKNAELLARAGVGINIGALTVAADYRLPFDSIVEYFKAGDYENADVFKTGKVSLSVLCSVF